MRKVIVSEPETRKTPLKVVGEDVTILGGDDQAKPFEVHIQHGAEGGGPPPHHHPWEEAFYVLDGSVEVTVNEETSVLHRGAFVQIPANTVHAYRNVSETATILGIVSDSRGGRLFEAMDREVKSLPDDLPNLLSLSERYGVEWAFNNDTR